MQSSSAQELKLHFRFYWKICDAEGDPDAVFNALLTCYSERHRRYHVVAHIGVCIRLFVKYIALAADPVAVFMALMFHDAVYRIGVPHGQNERESAELARQVFAEAGQPAFGEKVGKLILATIHDGENVDTRDAQLVSDIDLASLGFPPERFDEDGRNIRKEYAEVPDGVFFENQKKFLQKLLERSRIYHLPPFQERFEARARENLARAIAA